MAPKTEKKLIGVEAACKARCDPTFLPKAHIFKEFSLKDRVAVVTGAYGGLGLEMSLVLCELGAKVYGFDLPAEESSDFSACAEFAKRLDNGSKLTYVQGDVTNQTLISQKIKEIAAQEGRLDVCIAAAGVLGAADGHPCEEYPEAEWKHVLNVNTNGVFFTAQACASAMKEHGNAGSIILIASMSGSLTNRGHAWTAYNTSKSAVIQMARSMACELGADAVRVNSISPGHIYTKMTAALLDVKPEQAAKWADANPLGRIGHVHEVRGVVAWLSSDASTFCTGSDILVSGGHHAW
ncbi:hypothetical protein BDY24DRAFT_405346 [Mrakia frigida]|uniref:uncharacterized protein n=1 Tax=Mrakia frigida TaxID=29902 RepID=UPI003FCC2572